MTAKGKSQAGAAADQRLDVLAPADAGDFKRALRYIASPVAVVTARKDAEIAGQTATTFCSVSSDPPTFLICLNRNADVAAIIVESGRFAVSLLADEQHAVARRLSGPKAKAGTAFSGSEWRVLSSGAPVVDNAVACLDCSLEQSIEAGTHVLFLGRVLALSSADRDVLLYRDGLFRRLQPAG